MLPKVDYVSHNLSFLVEKMKCSTALCRAFDKNVGLDCGIQNHLAADDSFLFAEKAFAKKFPVETSHRSETIKGESYGTD